KPGASVAPFIPRSSRPVPDVEARRVRSTADMCETGRPDWSITPSDFESTMSITATVTVEGAPTASADDLLAAFAGDEVRGVAMPVSVGGQMVYFLTAYANTSGDTLSFRLYESATNLVRVAAVELAFAANAVEGTPASPFSIDVGCGSSSTARDVEGEQPEQGTLHPPFPSPFAHQTTFAYDLAQPAQVHLALYDLVGREVAVLAEGLKTAGRHTVTFQPDAALPSGVYVSRLRHGAHIASRTVIYAR
ncbi:MAG: hypothetical protein AAF730_17620, partial [Bacteroidota bacterium]